MISKADFTAEEWGELLAAPLMAAMAVTAADPSDLIGLIKENFASAKSLITAKQSSTNELIKALIDDLETSEGRAAARAAVEARFGHGTSNDIKSRALEALRQATLITAQKASAQADGFRTWLRETRQDRVRGLIGGWLHGPRRNNRQRGREGDAGGNRPCADRDDLNASTGAQSETLPWQPVVMSTDDLNFRVRALGRSASGTCIWAEDNLMPLRRLPSSAGALLRRHLSGS